MSQISTVLNAQGAGTVDVITATYSPALTAYTDKRVLMFRATGANTSTTPTFNTNALGAKTIVKKGNQALVAGDIPAARYIAIIQYDSTTDKFELLNPASDLDTQTLAQVLAQGNTTGGNKIIMSNGDNIEDPTGNIEMDFGQGFGYWAITTDNGVYVQPYIYIDTNSGYLADSTHGFFFGNFTAPGVTRFVHIRPGELELKHDVKVELDAPDINLIQETASLILSTDASKNIKGLPTVTYPSLAELAFVKGLTSAVQTQLNNKQPLDTQLTEIAALNPANDDIIQEKAGVLTNRTMAQLSADLTANLLIGYQGLTLQFSAGVVAASPADSTTYYCGSQYVNAQTTSVAALKRIYFPKAGTVKSVYLVFQNNVTGSSESGTVSLRLNNTTDTVISSAVTNDAVVTAFNNTGLSISVIAGDFFEIKWDTPVWATNPTGVFWGGTVYVE